MDAKVKTWDSPRRDPLVPGASLFRDARLKPKVIQTHPKNLTSKTPNFYSGEGGYIININSGCEGKLFFPNSPNHCNWIVPPFPGL